MELHRTAPNAAKQGRKGTRWNNQTRLVALSAARRCQLRQNITELHGWATGYAPSVAGRLKQNKAENNREGVE